MKKRKISFVYDFICGIPHPWNLNDNGWRAFQHGAYGCNGRLYDR